MFCADIHSQETIGAKSENWTVYNREVSFDKGAVHLNAKEGDGLSWVKDYGFSDGTIELEVKGKNNPGRSFVGIAFHGLDGETFDAVYFRPFNFKNPGKRANSVQYISMPGHDWRSLREAFPGKYESKIEPVPEPVDDWFQVKVVIDYPNIQVFINGATTPTLSVKQLSNRKKGKLGLWVGNGSEGWFRNLTIKHR